MQFMALLDNLKSYFTENVINGMDGTLQLEYKHATEYKPHIDPTDLPGKNLGSDSFRAAKSKPNTIYIKLLLEI